MRGVIAAGHPLTAQAGARVLEAGGNAVDAACAAVLMSFVAENLLTGPGAGGFMLVHTPEGEDVLLDFFVAVPGRGDTPEPAPLVPVTIVFSADASQEFQIGASSCGAYGTCAGIERALERFGTAPLADLCEPAVRAAREGVRVTEMQAYVHSILTPILRATAEAAAIYEPDGRPLREGEVLVQPELGDLIERLGSEGAGFLYAGDLAAAASDWVLSRGGVLSAEDLAAYEVIEREPARASFCGREVLTNPPPSSGGILITHALDALEASPGRADVAALVGAMQAANEARDAEFHAGLHDPGFLERFRAASRLGSTTHISVLDSRGGAASVTCSNGSCSGEIVPGTGLHLNNMLGEEDLNPLGFHRWPAGVRVPSMMAPTIVLREGVPELALGSAGSNRIRSAILQTVRAAVGEGLDADEAVIRPRVHVEQGVVEAEPGVEEGELSALEASGWIVRRWSTRNLYFGGVQAVARDPESGAFSGGGDPRRGGVALLVS